MPEESWRQRYNNYIALPARKRATIRLSLYNSLINNGRSQYQYKVEELYTKRIMPRTFPTSSKFHLLWVFGVPYSRIHKIRTNPEKIIVQRFTDLHQQIRVYPRAAENLVQILPGTVHILGEPCDTSPLTFQLLSDHLSDVNICYIRNIFLHKAVNSFNHDTLTCLFSNICSIIMHKN